MKVMFRPWRSSKKRFVDIYDMWEMIPVPGMKHDFKHFGRLRRIATTFASVRGGLLSIDWLRVSDSNLELITVVHFHAHTFPCRLLSTSVVDCSPETGTASGGATKQALRLTSRK